MVFFSSYYSHSRRDQHLGRRWGPLDLQRNQGCCHEADEIHHRRGRDAGACYQEGQAGISDSSRASPSPAAKAAQPTPPPAPKPVPPPLWLSGQLPANQRGTNNQRGQTREGRDGHIARGGQQAAGRGANPPGSAQRRGQRRPPRPLGPVVEQNMREFLFLFYFST